MNKICIASVAIINSKKELLLVRKKNSSYYQLVGGKIQTNETYEQTIVRETLEEIGYTISINNLQKLGMHTTQAVNEKNTIVEGHIYYLFLSTDFIPKIANEIDEYVWLNNSNYQNYQWAHLAYEFVLPFWKKLLK
jgi:8-oxo-dGTP diphosphatase